MNFWPIANEKILFFSNAVLFVSVCKYKAVHSAACDTALKAIQFKSPEIDRGQNSQKAVSVQDVLIDFSGWGFRHDLLIWDSYVIVFRV